MPAGLGHYNVRTQSGVATRPKGTLLSLRQNVRPNLGRTGLGFGTSDFQFRHTEQILIERNIGAGASHQYFPGYKSITTSPLGWEQQISRLPWAGGSSGWGW